MKLLFLDLDGTLLTDEKEINKGDMDAINEMLKAGHKVIINSGRPLYSIMIIAEKFGFVRDGFYLSAFNGGLIYDPSTGEKIKDDQLDSSIVRYMFDRAYEQGLHCHTYTDTHVISERATEALEFYTKRINMPALITDDFTKETGALAPKIILIDLDGRPRLEKYRELLKDYAKENNLYCTFSDSRLIEYANEKANKGEAVRYLCEYLNVDIKDTVSAGDEENDLPMIEAAGTGVSMKNGTDALKARADYITENTNNECGIREIIYKFIL